MNNPSVALTGDQLFWLIALIAVFCVDLLQFFSRRDPLAIYQPPVFVLGFMSYYCVIGPIQRAFENNWVHVNTDFRPVLSLGWIGALVFYLSLRCGYELFSSFRPLSRFAPPFEDQRSWRLGRNLCWIGVGLFTLANGLRVLAYLNPFAVVDSPFFYTSGLNLGPLTNYANSAINLLIPGTLLQFAVWTRTRKRFWPWLLWSLVALAIFTSIGFRWRIITLVVPMVLLAFAARGRRPSLLAVGFTGVGLLAFAGWIETTRGYGQGLLLDDAPAQSLGGMLRVGLNESSVFLVTSGLIANAPSGQPFVGLQPLVSTVLFPIPRTLWPDKDSFEYLSNAIAEMFGSTVLASGQAILNYAEYYLMFGWPSLILMGLLSGWVLRCLWNWFSPRRHETLAQVTYMSTCGLLYVWVSRGYMPQVAVTFAFGALPLFWIYYRQAVPHSLMAVRPEALRRLPPVA